MKTFDIHERVELDKARLNAFNPFSSELLTSFKTGLRECTNRNIDRCTISSYVFKYTRGEIRKSYACSSIDGNVHRGSGRRGGRGVERTFLKRRKPRHFRLIVPSKTSLCRFRDSVKGLYFALCPGNSTKKRKRSWQVILSKKSCRKQIDLWTIPPLRIFRFIFDTLCKK